MTTVNITLTSKNQITIPSNIVRDMRLAKHRQLSIRRRGNELILRPEPALADFLPTVWKQLPPFKGTKNDAELKQTTKDAWENKSL
jgi:bifunctional DNA-binding transcriptional regulator/antitoxin component of YhaV-PrlF toxin-antitoxin module